MGKKVSVIIPVYNVEKYLYKCVTSVINQDYSNLEIILVNDGSIDNSLNICNELKNKDKRIIVIDKENGGVSSARNIGIDRSTGDYITFIDADDWLEPNFISYMLTLIDNNSAEFALSKNCFINDEDDDNNDNVEILDNIEGTSLLLSPRVEVGCWNKIYNKKFLLKNKIRFNEKHFFGEGLMFITEVSQKSNKTVVGEKKVYHYRQNNLESATKKYKYKNFINGEESLDYIKNNLIINDNKVYKQLNLHYCLFYCNAIYSTVINKEKKHYNDKFKYWKNNAIKYSKIVFKYNDIPLKRKIIIWLNIHYTNLYILLKKLKKFLERLYNGKQK